jgi:hypothetical protein
LGRLQFEALITTARLSPNPNDFALIAMLGLLRLLIFEACGASIENLGEEHGHRVLWVRGKGGKIVFIPLPPGGSLTPAAVVGCDRGNGSDDVLTRHGSATDQKVRGSSPFRVREINGH